MSGAAAFLHAKCASGASGGLPDTKHNLVQVLVSDECLCYTHVDEAPSAWFDLPALLLCRRCWMMAHSAVYLWMKTTRMT